jgi:hypothetical protein
MHHLYPTKAESIWVLFDVRDRQACEHLHKQRAVWQELSDLAALGPDHMILMLFPGGAAGEFGTSPTKETQSG